MNLFIASWRLLPVLFATAFTVLGEENYDAKPWLDKEFPGLLELYKQLHAYP